MIRFSCVIDFSLVLLFIGIDVASAQETPWVRSWGSNGSDHAWQTISDGAGGTYVTGAFRIAIDFDPGSGTAVRTSNGLQDVFLVRYDKNGDFIFGHGLGNTLNDIGLGLAPDDNGGVWITGYFQDVVDFDPGPGTTALTAAGGFDIFLAHYDAIGALLSAGQMGGTGKDIGYALCPDGSGGVYIVGSFRDHADFDPGAGTMTLINQGMRDLFLAHYDASGALVFAKAIGGDDYDEAYGLTQDGTGGVYVTGSYRGTVDFDPGAGTAYLTSSGLEDAFVARYDVGGGLVFAFGLPGTEWAYGAGVAADGNGGVFVTGSFRGTVDFDPGAAIESRTAAGYEDVFLAQYDQAGQFQEVHTFGADGIDRGVDVASDGAGEVYVAGYFSNTVDFDPGGGTSVLTSQGATDTFVSRFDENAQWISAFHLGGAKSDEAGGIATDGLGGVFVSGTFRETVDFDPTASILQRTSVGRADAYVVPYAEHVTLEVSVFLHGPFSDPGMTNDLTAYLPLDQPYDGATFMGTAMAYDGPETLPVIPADMVDWVLVALRTAPDAASEVAVQAGILLTDGRIVGTDGMSPMRFSNVPKGDYHVIVHHRHHLSAMSAGLQSLGYTATSFDFTTGVGQAYGINPMLEVAPGVYGLWGGDGTVDGLVTAGDFLSVWLPANGGSPGYHQADFNMSGSVTAFDFLSTWLTANGRSTQVP